jgi:hypothetical protein
MPTCPKCGEGTSFGQLTSNKWLSTVQTAKQNSDYVK